MNALIVLCHPERKSLNGAIAARVRDALVENGVPTHVRDLYAEGFDPVLSPEELRRRFSLDERVQDYTNEVRWADLFIFVHPDWWGFAPAMLKGWLDRVFRPSVAYDYVGEEIGKKHHVGLLAGKRGLVLCTSDAESPPASGEAHPAAATWANAVFPFCGITRFHVEIFYDTRNARIRTRRQWLERACRVALELSH